MHSLFRLYDQVPGMPDSLPTQIQKMDLFFQETKDAFLLFFGTFYGRYRAFGIRLHQNRGLLPLQFISNQWQVAVSLRR
jgi:hypothetical protein